jgi:hypothetical protein
MVIRLAGVLGVLLWIAPFAQAQSDGIARLRDTTIDGATGSACTTLGVGCGTIAEHFIVTVGDGQKLVAAVGFRNHPYPLSASVVDLASGELKQGFNSSAEEPPLVTPCGPEFHYSILDCDFETSPAPGTHTYRFHVGRHPEPEPWEPTLLRATPGDNNCSVVFENEYANWQISVLTDGTCTASTPVWSAP